MGLENRGALSGRFVRRGAKGCSVLPPHRKRFARWREVRRELGKRGRRPPATLPTDGAGGLSKARDAVWPKAVRSRGWCHKRQNVQPKVPAPAWCEGKAVLVARWEAPTREKAEQRRAAIVAQYPRACPEACRCLRDAAAASLNPRAVPQRPPHYVRPSNRVARALGAARPRTKGLPHLWNEGRLVNLGFGVLIRVSDRWGKKCWSELEQPQLRSWRAKLKWDDHEVSTLESPIHGPSRRSAASTA